jgi:putative transposase
MAGLIPPELLDLAAWPTVDPTALAEPRRADLLARMEAVRLYVGRATVQNIEASTGVQRSVLYRLLRRCIGPHADGRIRGFRALIPYARAKRYERIKPVAPTVRNGASGTSGTPGGAGSSGAMTALLERHESLTLFLRRCLAERVAYIGAVGQLCGLHRVHRGFLDACRELGLRVTDYPLNQDRQGIRSLAKALRALALQSFAGAARAAGAQRVSAPWSDAAYSREPGARRPLEIVEFDGHKLDIRLRVRYEDGAGVAEDIDINRVWLLVIIDVFSRVILGWNLVLSAEYDRNDVMRTIQQALLPQRKRVSLSIPGLSYSAAGGFACEVFPRLEGACWERLRLDNARANLAPDTLSMLCSVVGCAAEAGPVASPTERPYVERFFGTLTRTLSHRLPGSTGASVNDIRRRLSDPATKDLLTVSFDELLELMEVTIADYNGTPHDGIGARSPLEFLGRAMDRHGHCVRVLSEPFRRQLCVLQPSRICPVAGSLKAGKRPYINLFGVRYSSRLLQTATDLMGKSLRIFIDPQDLRVVHAYLETGAEFGPLAASRPWHLTQHSVRLRQEIMRLRRQRKLQFSEGDDPVRVFLDFKRKQLTKQRGRAGHRTAEAARAVAAPPDPSTTPSPVPEQASEPNRIPVKPRSLSKIGKGQVMAWSGT